MNEKAVENRITQEVLVTTLCRWCKAAIQPDATVCGTCTKSQNPVIAFINGWRLIEIITVAAAVWAAYTAYQQSNAATVTLAEVQEIRSEIDKSKNDLIEFTGISLDQSIASLASIVERISYTCGILREYRFEITDKIPTISDTERASIQVCHHDIKELIFEVNRNIQLASELGRTVLTQDEVKTHIERTCTQLDTISFELHKNGSSMGSKVDTRSNPENPTIFAMSAQEILKNYGPKIIECSLVLSR